jgi:hypothetical protein
MDSSHSEMLRDDDVAGFMDRRSRPVDNLHSERFWNHRHRVSAPLEIDPEGLAKGLMKARLTAQEKRP